jgi:2',3'-cyclic-nucleotide 2'-phosphodiesterase (5'-nucleotidase family)
MATKIRILSVFIVILSLVLPVSAFPKVGAAAPAAAITFTILHTNDVHGQLEASGSNPGMARVASVVNGVRTAVGATNVLLVDAGDEMQGSLLSNLQKGLPTIATFNGMGYNVATFGNHEFDWGQPTLSDRTNQATYPFVSANIVKGTCDASNWTVPDQFKVTPFVVQTLNTSNGAVRVAFIGVTTTETPIITIASSTAGLCFKDPADAILHYYDTMKSQADVIVVLSHLGFNDGGYGYGIPVYGDKTLAQKLIDAGKPVPLIIGGHSHTDLGPLSGTPVPANLPPNYVVVGGTTSVVQAYYNGRRVGRADLTFDATTKNVTVSWQSLIVDPAGTKDPTIDALITGYASDPTYQGLINQPIGYSAVDLPRLGGTVDNMMGTFIDDAIYNYLNTDATPANDIDIFFNNAGGIRTDWCYNGTAWVNIGCVDGAHAPALLTYGNMFTILPFGNATVVGKMTGAQILQVLNQAPLVSNGVIQPAGLKFKYFAYRDANPGPQPYAWGAFDYCVVNKTTHNCDPLDMNKTYSVGTNEFLAPGGGDGYGGFKYMTNITYWGDMLNAVDNYVSANYGTPANAYMGPNNNGTLDGRIVRDGTNTCCGSIIPITILHNDDSHGNLVMGTYVGYTNLATLIKQERLHNPTRTLLLNGGDQIQGDAMMYYFKSAPLGYAADGTPLPANLQTQPEIAVMNSLNYDAMTLGNHEFNFGATVFDGIFKQVNFPLLAANLTDTGAYGLSSVGPGGQGVKPYIEKTLDGIPVAIVGLTNPRVPNYELPSNIPGLTFTNPITAGQDIAPGLKAKGDVVIALTHIGFTSDINSVSYDPWVDTNFAAQVPGVDAILGAHSHTNPASPDAPYKFLPTIIGGPNNTPVIVANDYRYNSILGEIIIGVRAKPGGGYEVVSRAGEYISVTKSIPEDAATKAIVDPYTAQLNTYYNQVVGQTTVPIDTRTAFTEETNGANLQAEASVWELAKHGITDVDFHLSGAMTNNLMASVATVANPVTLKISDMFAGMPYENSLVVLKMNGPQLKAVLERAYRNYYYYKYVPGRGGYSYYTTCMIDINNVGRIYYRDANPTLPDGNNVVALIANGKPVDFTDATKFYNVSTVNYLAAGSCNFNDNGVSLWPLNQIVHDTQYYVRDAVIDYIMAKGTVSPAVEGRLLFGDTVAPVITINAPVAQAYLHPDFLTLDFSAVDGPDGTTPSLAAPSGVKTIQAKLDGTLVTNGQLIDLHTLSLGDHTLTVVAADFYGNTSTKSVTFSVTATVQSLMTSVNRFYTERKIDNKGIRISLLSELNVAQFFLNRGQVKVANVLLGAFIFEVKAQKGKHIQAAAADLLITDANYIINALKTKPLTMFTGPTLDSGLYMPTDGTVIFIPVVK